MQALAAADDSRDFFAILCRALPIWFPHTRADLLVSDWDSGMCMPLVGDDAALPAPSDAGRNADAFAIWLADHGYGAVAMQPLNGAGRHMGWLVLARRSEPFGDAALALAAQLAALISLRLLHEFWADALAQREDTISKLDQRMQQHEELRLRATLAVGTAHDIGNLLAAVVGHAQLLQREAPQRQRRDLQTIVRAARDGNVLLRRLIALKASDAVSSVVHPVDLPTLVSDALELTRPFWDARADIEIYTEIASLPPVRAHITDIREVLINLIINAVSAMPAGGRLLLRGWSDHDCGVIEVSDSGTGIAPEHQKLIFQPLASLSEGGLGLGLSVSRALAETYDGSLTVRSTPGNGATFTLTLPLAELKEIAIGGPIPSATPQALR
jgi:signal transduction histidine kinase